MPTKHPHGLMQHALADAFGDRFTLGYLLSGTNEHALGFIEGLTSLYLVEQERKAAFTVLEDTPDTRERFDAAHRTEQVIRRQWSPSAEALFARERRHERHQTNPYHR